MYEVAVNGSCFLKSVSTAQCYMYYLNVNASTISENASFANSSFVSCRASSVMCCDAVVADIYSTLNLSRIAYIKDQAIVDKITVTNASVNALNVSLTAAKDSIASNMSSLSTSMLNLSTTMSFQNLSVTKSLNISKPYTFSSSFNSASLTPNSIGYNNLFQTSVNQSILKNNIYTVVSASFLPGVYYVTGNCFFQGPQVGASSYKYGLSLSSDGTYDDPSAMCALNSPTGIGSGGNGFAVPVTRFLSINNPSSLYLTLSTSNSSVTLITGSGFQFVRIA
jgi:hypothetical protein